MGRASPGCEKKGGAPTAEWGLIQLLPKCINRWSQRGGLLHVTSMLIISKEMGSCCWYSYNNNDNNNKNNTPVIPIMVNENLTTLHLPARLLSQV
jgi:hypothetical protein